MLPQEDHNQQWGLWDYVIWVANVSSNRILGLAQDMKNSLYNITVTLAVGSLVGGLLTVLHYHFIKSRVVSGTSNCVTSFLQNVYPRFQQNQMRSIQQELASLHLMIREQRKSQDVYLHSSDTRQQRLESCVGAIVKQRRGRVAKRRQAKKRAKTIRLQKIVRCMNKTLAANHLEDKASQTDRVITESDENKLLNIPEEELMKLRQSLFNYILGDATFSPVDGRGESPLRPTTRNDQTSTVQRATTDDVTMPTKDCLKLTRKLVKKKARSPASSAKRESPLLDCAPKTESVSADTTSTSRTYVFCADYTSPPLIAGLGNAVDHRGSSCSYRDVIYLTSQNVLIPTRKLVKDFLQNGGLTVGEIKTSIMKQYNLARKSEDWFYIKKLREDTKGVVSSEWIDKFITIPSAGVRKTRSASKIASKTASREGTRSDHTLNMEKLLSVPRVASTPNVFKEKQSTSAGRAQTSVSMLSLDLSDSTVQYSPRLSAKQLTPRRQFTKPALYTSATLKQETDLSYCSLPSSARKHSTSPHSSSHSSATKQRKSQSASRLDEDKPPDKAFAAKRKMFYKRTNLDVRPMSCVPTTEMTL